MKPSQSEIFWIASPTGNESQSNSSKPSVGSYLKRGFEIIYVHESLIPLLSIGYKFHNIAEPEIVDSINLVSDSDSDDELQLERKPFEQFEHLTQWLTQFGLKGLIFKAVISERSKSAFALEDTNGCGIMLIINPRDPSIKGTANVEMLTVK